MGLAKKKTNTPAQSDSTHYIVAKSSNQDVDDRKYVSFYSKEGNYGEMIGTSINENNIERFIDFAEFINEQVEAGNSVYLNFNAKKAD